jgi:Ion channel
LSRDNELGGQSKSKRGFLLLLSLVALILIHPQLDQSLSSRLILGFLTFVPIIVAAVKLSHKKVMLWIFVALLAGGSICMIAGSILANQILLAIHWGMLAVLFGLAVFGLFAYLRQASVITPDHLFTAASIYLLLASLWFTIYKAIETVQPASFLQTVTGATHPRIDLLYFSLATLTTLGYGDIVPVGDEVRTLAALEAAVGVLYVAITVALLVSAYKPRTEQ